MCAHGREIGRGAGDAVHRSTDNEFVAAAYDVLWYNLNVLSGSIRLAIASCRKAVATAVRKPIPIDRKRCKAIVSWNVGSFGMTILMQRYAHTPARLSPYFMQGILQPQERSERGRFFFRWLGCEKGE